MKINYMQIFLLALTFSMVWVLIGWFMLRYHKRLGDTIMMLHGDGAKWASGFLLLVTVVFWPCPLLVLWPFFFLTGLWTISVKRYYAVRNALSLATYRLRKHKKIDDLTGILTKEMDNMGNVVVRYPTVEDVKKAANDFALPLDTVAKLRERWFNEVNT